MPLVGFLPPDDPRVRGTVQAIEQRPDGRRAACCATTPNDSPTACRRGRARSSPAASGWSTRMCMHGALRTTRARLFERLLALRNDVGLLTEEYDPQRRQAGRQLSAGVLARGAGQQRIQSDPMERAGGAARAGEAGRWRSLKWQACGSCTWSGPQVVGPRLEREPLTPPSDAWPKVRRGSLGQNNRLVFRQMTRGFFQEPSRSQEKIFLFKASFLPSNRR